MLVSRIVGDCPGCKGVKTFGNVSVRRDHVLRGCLRCKYSEPIPLPTIRKKIVYLDQCFFSHAFRAKEKRFVEAAEKLREASALQLMVVPFSSVHEDETHQWKGREEELMMFIRDISFGHEFEPYDEVEETQLCRAFESFLSSGPSAFRLQEADAIEEKVHDWDDYLYITIPIYHGNADRIRNDRQQCAEAMADAFDHWRATPNTFEQQTELEMRDQANLYLQAFMDYAAKVAKGDLDAFITSPLISAYVERLIWCIPQAQIPGALGILEEFFLSEHYNQIPYLWITARIYACLNDEVQKGAYKNRKNAIDKLRGLYGDMKHAATYAPYCDAIFMEKKITAYLSDSRINIEGRYGVKLFSPEKMGDFIAWIDQIIEQTTETHRQALSVIFPGIKLADNHAFARAILGNA